MRVLSATIRGGLLVCLLWGTAAADTIRFTAELTPANSTVTGKGAATLSLDTAARMLNWTIQYSGLKAPPAMAGLLAPAAKPDAEPEMVPVALPAGAASPIKGSTPLTNPQIAGIEGGQWILLIGTAEAPELGGAVKRAP